ncbi:MAG: hypothetical protein EU539_13450 [Promethearchaeota archaeon]|nr:MAG: hypothetical protein EU539_13450 [Candidatus Lokiarchaeota archaeon]
MNSSEPIFDVAHFKKWKESSMERHDNYNFESKIDYILDRTPSEKESSYLLEVFLFIPENLQINRESYSKEQFFLDLNNRIRFKTPQMTIQGLLDEDNKLSPIHVVLKKLKEIEYGEISHETHIRIEREIRLLACIVKASLRDQFTFILTFYQKLKEQGNFASVISNYLDDIVKLESKMSFLRETFSISQISYNLREALNYADEYISLQIKTWIAKSLIALEKQIDNDIRNKMIKIIEREQDFRKSINSQLILEEHSENETFTYHESILKKYVQGVLYLEKKKKDPKSRSLEFLYSFAAGIAMFFSLFLTVLLLAAYDVNSIPFIILAIVIYIFKDRLKDIFRGYSQKAVGLVFPDQRVDIVDNFYQKTIGESREKVRFIEWGDIPDEILRVRRSSNKSPLEEAGKPEVVISYLQKITLLNEKIDEIHTRKKDLSNIIRFNIQDFLKYADDPIQHELLWNDKTAEVEEVPISKVYHLNIVLKLSSYKGKNIKRLFFKKFRVVLDQKGIKRIEEPDILL